MFRFKNLVIISTALTLNVLLLNSGFGQKSFNNQIDIIDPTVNPGNMLDEMRLPPARTLGTHMYNEAWKPGIVYLTSEDVIEGYNIRFDVQKNQLEIKGKEQVKICAFHRIDKFKLVPSFGDTTLFISTNNFKFEDGVPLTGFFELLYDGDMDLFSRSKIELLESNYVPTVDVGRRENKIVIREDYFVEKDGIIYEVQSRLKKNQHFFGTHYDAVKQFSRDQRLKFNNREDLVKLFDFYDSLI